MVLNNLMESASSRNQSLIAGEAEGGSRRLSFDLTLHFWLRSDNRIYGYIETQHRVPRFILASVCELSLI